ncbi:MAG: hypothetical protein M3P95_02175, partial [Actinomycetota bacterium]|nr:hypothetical protein [Actinomycetota bacterium]
MASTPPADGTDDILASGRRVMDVAASVSVSRQAVLAFRAAANGLHRDGTDAATLALDLGVQDTPPGSAGLALAARLGAAPDTEGLALAWSARGAPRLHRPGDLPALAAALWPLSDADATARYATGVIPDGGRLG